MMDGDTMKLRFWGVRGSIPCPGKETLVVGGNTSCVEIEARGTRLILDAGSGLRGLGDAIMARREDGPITILLTHVHWDHVMGIPFFTPLYVKGKQIVFASGPNGRPLREVLRGQMQSPMFPVAFDAVGADVRCVDLDPEQHLELGPIHVAMTKLAHPDPVYAYRVSVGGRSIVFATDTEHDAVSTPQLIRFAHGADVLIYDAQYTPEEYAGEIGPGKKGWGHSTFEIGTEIAKAANVKTLALFHHDPQRTDDGVAAIVQRARALFPNTIAAREGLHLELELHEDSRHEAREVALAL